MGARVPGVEGIDPPLAGERQHDTRSPGRAHKINLLTGLHAPVPRTADRIITAVTKDWDPPHPRATPQIVVRGRTLVEVANELNRLAEWGEGGGMLRTDRVPVGTSASVKVHLHANLVLRMPRWANYASASRAARAEWDRMVGVLRVHEQRHVAIAIEEAETLAHDLMGQEIGQIAPMVTEANRRMNSRQIELDTATDHGAKESVPFGDVILDTTII